MVESARTVISPESVGGEGCILQNAVRVFVLLAEPRTELALGAGMLVLLGRYRQERGW